ncbi:MAG: transporter substrate-binding domain-containing protein [Ruminococcaceae bacterium]|nr:transporter substrate-binding domain-containing protein [Oscillospiraceae bacterium]
MKKIIALALATLMVLGMFAGCGASGADGLKTVTPGKLTVAISPDFAPMEFVDPTKDGQDMYVGFDVTLAKTVAEKLGLELVIMPMSFDACQTAVYAGTVDMSISGYSWTEERAENYNISNYYHAGDNEDEQILITLASNGDKFATVEGLAGAKIGAQNASLQQSLTEEQLADNELVLFTDLGTAVLQLKNGDFDCIAVADGNGEAIIAANPEIAKSGFSFVVDEKYTGNVILLQKGADDLTAKVNEILAETESQWDAWYEEAKAISGIDQSYDDAGNAITG